MSPLLRSLYAPSTSKHTFECHREAWLGAVGVSACNAKAFRKNMAAAAYALTSSYDSAVSAWMAGEAQLCLGIAAFQ